MDQVLADTLTANLKSAQAVLSAHNALHRQDPRIITVLFERPNARRAQRGDFSQLG